MELEALRNALWADVAQDKTLRVFSLQDSAADVRLHPNMMLSLMDHACLYEGRLPQVLEQAAPHIVRLAATAPYTRWFLETGWGRHWCILFQAHANLPVLRAHFQRLLLVKDEAGRRFTFRYYDPRILRTYLPTCTPDELRKFFGPVERFFCESDNGKELLAYERVEGGLKIRRFAMAFASRSASAMPEASSEDPQASDKELAASKAGRP
jgi:hypothetical protein